MFTHYFFHAPSTIGGHPTKQKSFKNMFPKSYFKDFLRLGIDEMKSSKFSLEMFAH